MSQTAPGFSDLTQEPFVDIPTEPEAFLRWGTTLDRHHPYKHELSNGKVSRLMIQVSRAHWLVTANILGELLQKVDHDRFLIVEVLSPSTAGLDFTAKLQEYKRIPSVQTYLICSQDEPRAWVWARQGDGSWPKLPRELIGREDRIALGGLDIELAMAAISRGIPDAPTVP
jgi:hypothetical protein